MSEGRGGEGDGLESEVGHGFHADVVLQRNFRAGEHVEVEEGRGSGRGHSRDVHRTQRVLNERETQRKPNAKQNMADVGVTKCALRKI